MRTTAESPAGQDNGVITNPKFRMWLRPDGIVQLAWTPRLDVLLEDAVAAFTALAPLTGGRATPLLVDMREVGQLDRAARLEFARRYDTVSAVALVVGTPLTRMIGNLFMRMNKPLTPTKMFDKEAPAVEWLIRFLG